MGRIKDGVRAIVLATHHNRGTFILKTVLCLLVLSCVVAAVVFGNYETFFLCVLTLVLFMVPPFIEAHFSITIPETLEVVIVLFIFAAEILGEVFHFYTIVPFWDTRIGADMSVVTQTPTTSSDRRSATSSGCRSTARR